MKVKPKDEGLYREHISLDAMIFLKTGFDMQALLKLHACLITIIVDTVTNIIYNRNKVTCFILGGFAELYNFYSILIYIYNTNI